MDWITAAMGAGAVAVLAGPALASMLRPSAGTDLLSDLRVVRRVGEAMSASGNAAGVRAANALIEAALSIPVPESANEAVRS